MRGHLSDRSFEVRGTRRPAQRGPARILAHPQRYVNHVYGETENGGTSYLILSHVPFQELGLPDLGTTPVKDVSEAVMGMTIPFALTWGAVLTGVSVGVACT